jgi:hypothetical protein
MYIYIHHDTFLYGSCQVISLRIAAFGKRKAEFISRDLEFGIRKVYESIGVGEDYNSGLSAEAQQQMLAYLF